MILPCRRLVQGDVVKKNTRKINKKYFPAGWIYGSGFLLGVLIPNMIWKTEWNQKTIASVYLLSIFAGKDLKGKEFILQVLRMRSSVFVLAALCGITVFGTVISVTGLWASGMLLGMVLTISVLEFGIPGCAIGMGLIFPQYIIYIPCLMWLFTEVYRQSARTWQNQAGRYADLAGYTGHILLCALVYGTGIFMEICLNPIVLELLMKTIDLP